MISQDCSWFDSRDIPTYFPTEEPRDLFNPALVDEMYKEQQQHIPWPQNNTCPRFGELNFPHCINIFLLSSISCVPVKTITDPLYFIKLLTFTRNATVLIDHFIYKYADGPRRRLVSSRFPGRWINSLLATKKQQRLDTRTQQSQNSEEKSPDIIMRIIIPLNSEQEHWQRDDRPTIRAANSHTKGH